MPTFLVWRSFHFSGGVRGHKHCANRALLALLLLSLSLYNTVFHARLQAERPHAFRWVHRGRVEWEGLQGRRLRPAADLRLQGEQEGGLLRETQVSFAPTWGRGCGSS